MGLVKKYVTWKTSFWILFLISLFVSLFFSYMIVDQAITINYMQIGYKNTKENLEDLMDIVPKISKEVTRDELINIISDSYPNRFVLMKDERIYVNDLAFEFDEHDKFTGVTR